MSVNLAFCFIRAAYEYESKRDGEKERKKRWGTGLQTERTENMESAWEGEIQGN